MAGLSVPLLRTISETLWLWVRFQELLELANSSGKLRRVFVWGSFVTAKPAPKDLDILLIMDEEFEVERIAIKAQAVFDSVRAKLLFESDVFWARASIGDDFLQLWLETYQTSRSSKTRYRGTRAAVIQTDEQMLLAQQCIGNLRSILLLQARKVHSRQDYARMAEPILLEVQQREQDILEYLSGNLEHPVAS